MIQQNDEAVAMDRPRLLHMTTVPLTLNFLEGQIQYAKNNGLEVHAISSPDAALVEFGARLRIQVHELLMSRRITPLRDLFALWRFSSILRQLRPQIVHGHTPKGGLLAMIGAWWCGVPVRIYHIHGLPMMTATGLKRLLLRSSERISCLLASQVYCVSKSVRDVAVGEGLCPEEKIKVLLNGTINGIDAVTRFNPDRVDADSRNSIRKECNIPVEALVVGFVGRIVRDKGIIELTQAWKVLREEFPNLHLLILGPIEPQDPVPTDVAQQLRNDERIHLTGWLGPEEIPRHYRAMDALALPTYREGFGLVLLEASAMELPVVASRVPGCIDGIIDGETGALVPSHDAAALAEALRVYLNDADLRHRHGLAGRDRVLRDFRPEDMNQAIYQEYVRLLRNKGIFVLSEGGSESICDAEAGAIAGRNCDQPAERMILLSSRTTFYRRYGKRIFDFFVGAMALLLLSPLLVLLAVLVRVLLGGPILFQQQRTGVNKQPFTILKFRSMTTACDADGNLLTDMQRLTRFGRLLRGTSLDELPELWNVLLGEMSLVGPRPLLPRYDSSYTDRESRRFDLLPGITGWAQINGRNELAWDDRLECDVHYVETCTMGLDLKILFLTIIKVLRRDNVQVDPGMTFGLLDEERKQQAANPTNG